MEGTAEPRYYLYGMRLRPFMPGCQPMNGLEEADEDKSQKYWNILKYSRPLTDHEQDSYELDFIGTED